MKRTHYISVIAFAAMTTAALTACSDKLNNNNSADGDIEGKALLTATIEESSSRTTYTDDGTSYSSGGKVVVNWAKDDTVRLYKAVGETGTGADTVVFKILKGVGSKNGTFGLKWEKAQDPDDGIYPAAKKYNKDLQYKAIYPAPKDDFNRARAARSLTAEAFLSSPSNTPQVQDGGNNNMAHLARYDMLTATKAAGKSNIQLQHEVAVLKVMLHFTMTGALAPFQGAKARLLSIKAPTIFGSKIYQVSIPDAVAPVMTTGKSTVAFYITVPSFTANIGDEMEIQTVLYKKLATPVTEGGTVVQDANVLTIGEKHKFTATKSFAKGCIYEIKQAAATIISNIPVVDLGNGQIWATRNIGAKDAYDDGHYFQWGETNGFEFSGPLMLFRGWDAANSRETYQATDIVITERNCLLNGHTYQQLFDLGFRKITVKRVAAASTWGSTHGGDSTIYEVPDYQGLLIYMKPRSYTPATRTYTPTTETKYTYGTTNGESFFYLTAVGNPPQCYVTTERTYPTWFNTYSGQRYYRGTSYGTQTSEDWYVGDAATYQWGDAWHMPTMNQYTTLLTTTTMRNAYNNKIDLIAPNGMTHYRKFVSNTGTAALIIPNCYGWDKGDGASAQYKWYESVCDGNNFANCQARLQTTTAARGRDAYFMKDMNHDNEDTHCWEMHFRFLNGATWASTDRSYSYNGVNAGDNTFKLGMHSHHPRATAVPIRPILKLDPDIKEYLQ